MQKCKLVLIVRKKQKVKLLEDEIGFISETQKETQEFMSNLEKFI